MHLVAVRDCGSHHRGECCGAKNETGVKTRDDEKLARASAVPAPDVPVIFLRSTLSLINKTRKARISTLSIPPIPHQSLLGTLVCPLTGALRNQSSCEAKLATLALGRVLFSNSSAAVRTYLRSHLRLIVKRLTCHCVCWPPSDLRLRSNARTLHDTLLHSRNNESYGPIPWSLT